MNVWRCVVGTVWLSLVLWGAELPLSGNPAVFRSPDAVRMERWMVKGRVEKALKYCEKQKEARAEACRRDLARLLLDHQRIEEARAWYRGRSDEAGWARMTEACWACVEQAGQAEIVRRFLFHFPESEHRAQAEERLEQVVWEACVQGSSEQAYQEYLTAYPQGRFAVFARQGSDGGAWWEVSVRESGKWAPLLRFLLRYPESRYRDEVLARLGTFDEAGLGEIGREHEAALSDSERQDCEHLVEQVGRGRDIDMLRDLHHLLSKDSSLVERARPYIRIVLVAILFDQQGIRQDQAGALERTEDVLEGFRLIAAEQERREAGLGFESVALPELLMHLVDARVGFMREKILGGMARASSFRDLQQLLKRHEHWVAVGGALNTLKSLVNDLGVVFLGHEKLTLTLGARRYLWGFVQRTLGGGTFWKETGIEGDDDTLPLLEKALAREQDPALRSYAESVMDALREKRRLLEEKKTEEKREDEAA